MKMIMRILSTLCAMYVMAPCALAQITDPPATNIVFKWSPPITNTDGSTITGALTYNLYQGPSAGPFTKVVTNTNLTTATITSLTPGGCFILTTVEAIGTTSTTESAATSQICPIIPSAPTGLIVTVVLSFSTSSPSTSTSSSQVPAK